MTQAMKRIDRNITPIHKSRLPKIPMRGYNMPKYDLNVIYQISNKCQRNIIEMPVIGFNVSKYDLNLILCLKDHTNQSLC